MHMGESDPLIINLFIQQPHRADGEYSKTHITAHLRGVASTLVSALSL